VQRRQPVPIGDRDAVHVGREDGLPSGELLNRVGWNLAHEQCIQSILVPGPQRVSHIGTEDTLRRDRCADRRPSLEQVAPANGVEGEEPRAEVRLAAEGTSEPKLVNPLGETAASLI